MLLEQLQEEYITALKTKDRIKKEILSYVIAQIKNKQIDLRETLNDDEIIKVIKKEIKSRQEALGFLEQSQDTAGVHEEKAKMQILQTYLPVQLTEEQLRNIVQEQVALL
ncbi:MAG: GatB/YqeY domain-containing protein [Candidatus Peribacteria bacterium]|nr:MAG: GatB/YqeY domain-containing protein [Candidatus Peribacteria bacterium]